MLRSILILFLFTHSQLSFAQKDTLELDTLSRMNKAVIFYNNQSQTNLFKSSDSIASKPVQKGQVILVEDDSLQLLIDGYREQKTIEGYRIQLFSGRSRMEAVKVKSSFHKNYGEAESVEILYQQPNFKIRVGNYRDRLTANKWLGVYKVDYPSSFIVKDNIKLEFD